MWGGDEHEKVFLSSLGVGWPIHPSALAGVSWLGLTLEQRRSVDVVFSKAETRGTICRNTITNIRGGEPIKGRAVLAEICSSQLQSFLPAGNLLPRWELWGCLESGAVAQLL